MQDQAVRPPGPPNDELAYSGGKGRKTYRAGRTHIGKQDRRSRGRRSVLFARGTCQLHSPRSVQHSSMMYVGYGVEFKEKENKTGQGIRSNGCMYPAPPLKRFLGNRLGKSALRYL